MAKVFPLFFFVVVLAVSVLFFMIPTQEQPANAYVDHEVSNIVFDDHNGVDVTASTHDFDGLISYEFYIYNYELPFSEIYIDFPNDDRLTISCSVYGGLINISWQGTGLLSEYNDIYSEPINYIPTYYGDVFSISLYVYRRIGNTYRVYMHYNKKPLRLFYNKQINLGYGSFTITFTDANIYGEPYPLSYWDLFENNEIYILSCLSTPNQLIKDIDFTNWDNYGYDAGYIDGMNEANDAKANLFPSLIGSIFAFFVSLASYEVLGISLLNIMIIVGSVLLLLAILRIFLK